MRELIDPDEDDGMTPESEMIEADGDCPVFGDPNRKESDEDYLDVHIGGSEQLQAKLRALCKEYRDIFSNTLPAQPARVTPMEFTVDEERWSSRENRQTFRRQSIVKDQEIGLQIEVMLKSKVIARSNATSWSQVLLTPKPGMKWRFCVDFRLLNSCMNPKGWPLPRIPEIIQRIGNQRSTIFGKMDLTSGYWQTPLATSARRLTVE